MKDTYVYEEYGNLYVNLTNRCSNACDFCVRNVRDGVEGRHLWLSREPVAAEVTAVCPPNLDGFSEVVFCGYGEPTYRLDVLLECAAFFKAKGKRVRLDTNGHSDLINGFAADFPESFVGIDGIASVTNAPSAHSTANDGIKNNVNDKSIDNTANDDNKVSERITDSTASGIIKNTDAGDNPSDEPANAPSFDGTSENTPSGVRVCVEEGIGEKSTTGVRVCVEEGIGEKSTAALLKGLVDIVSVSLNASTAGGYDKLCRSSFDNAFPAMLSFALSCKREGIEVVMSVVDVIGESEIAACAALCERLGLPLRVRTLILPD